MTLRENAMAIYNREQPDFYGDLMDAIELIPDPSLQAICVLRTMGARKRSGRKCKQERKICGISLRRRSLRKIHPDIIFYHDDWGSKQNVFLPPRVWKQIIKPLQQEISDVIHECGMIYMHHADCICQPIVTDMVEIGVDIWQGVIFQNDIVEIQRITEGKLAMAGGINGPKIDIENITEEQIRQEVRWAIDTYCPAGRFYPSIPNDVRFRPWNNSIVMDELASYGRKFGQ